jgi:hypothetical protein
VRATAGLEADGSYNYPKPDMKTCPRPPNQNRL